MTKRIALGFFIKLAWRNVFRNRRRTFLTGLIIGIGLSAMMFMDAWVQGMKENMISSTTSSFLGEAQIHRDSFQETMESEFVIAERKKIVSLLEEDETVKTFTERVVGFGTVSSPTSIESIAVYGIDPLREPGVSGFDDELVAGSYPGDGNGLMIGEDLAEELELAVGDRAVLTAPTAGSGELSQELFRVTGIYKMHIKELDSSLVLVPLPAARRLLGVGEETHEIAVVFKDSRTSRISEGGFSDAYSIFGNKAETWEQLVPEMKKVMDLTDMIIGITVVIVFAIIIFGIMNTLFMSVYERIFEFGVLRAVGTRPSTLRTLIVVEAAALALYSVALGTVLGTAFIGLGMVFGMDLSGVEFSGATFTGRIYTVFAPRQFMLHPILVFLFTVLVSLYPARFAGRMSVTKALHRSM